MKLYVQLKKKAHTHKLSPWCERPNAVDSAIRVEIVQWLNEMMIKTNRYFAIFFIIHDEIQ